MLADRVQDTGTFSTQLSVANADGSKARELGAKWLDGELLAYFVFDPAAQAPKQLNVDGQPIVEERL